jgi:hypothetical protein
MSAPPPVTQPAPEAAGSRPDGTAFGLGIGYQLPTSLETPNVASLRVRLAGGLTFEPAFTISNASETAEMTGVEATNKHTTFSLAARGRMPLISRGKADFEGLAELGFTNDKDNPDGDFNTTTTNAFDIGWGLAVGYWFTQHWQFTFNVTNPLVTFSSRKIQNAGETTKDSTTELGLTFNPAVFMMLHLYN